MQFDRRAFSVQGYLKRKGRWGGVGAPRRNWMWQATHYSHVQSFWRRGNTSCHTERKSLPKYFGRLLTTAIITDWDWRIISYNDWLLWRRSWIEQTASNWKVREHLKLRDGIQCSRERFLDVCWKHLQCLVFWTGNWPSIFHHTGCLQRRVTQSELPSISHPW